MSHENEIEKLLRGSVASLTEFMAALDGMDEASQEAFRILQKQIKVQGQILMRLAAAVDGLSQDSD